MEALNKEPGFYWIMVEGQGQGWIPAEVSMNYVWTCGWEVPIPLEDITWDPKLVPPQ